MKRLLVFLLPMVLLVFVLPALARAQESAQNHAGVVVRFGDGQVATACVAFPEPSISGLQLLQRSGIPIVTQGSGIGAAVCKIEDEGCEYPTEDCFCKRDGTRSTYWAYSRLREGAWAYSPLGASNTKVLPGDVDGWAWGDGDTETGAQPPVLTFEQVCALAAEPAPTAVPPSEPSVVPPTARPTLAPSAVPTETSATVQPSATQALMTDVPTTATLQPSATQMPATDTPPVVVAVVPTAIAIATALPTLVVATPQATAATPQPAGEPASALNYVLFGLIALALLVAIVIVLRRR